MGPGSSCEWNYNSTYRGYNPSYLFIRPFIGVLAPFKGPTLYNYPDTVGSSEVRLVGMELDWICGCKKRYEKREHTHNKIMRAIQKHGHI